MKHQRSRSKRNRSQAHNGLKKIKKNNQHVQETKRVTSQFAKKILYYVLPVIVVLFALVFYDYNSEASITRRLQSQLDVDIKELLLSSRLLRTYSDEWIGWLFKNETDLTAYLSRYNITDKFERLYRTQTNSINQLLLSDAHSYIYAIVPGLFTSWYPGYMSDAVRELKLLDLDVRVISLNTEASVTKNADALREWTLNTTKNTSNKKIIFLGHSKGAVDVAAALAMYFNELNEHTAALIAMQAPYGGCTLCHDLANTQTRKEFVFGLIKTILGGHPDCFTSLAYTNRKEWILKYPYLVDQIPTISLATSASMAFSLLKPSIDYIQFRYNQTSDGCVSQIDAIIPNAPFVYLNDLDHFGPAYGSFPGMGTYHPARLILSLIKLIEKDIHKIKFK
jgi:hypothetical protein